MQNDVPFLLDCVLLFFDWLIDWLIDLDRLVALMSCDAQLHKEKCSTINA